MTEFTDAAGGPYPYTPHEHEQSFFAKARAIEEHLLSLSQDVYNLAVTSRSENRPTFAQVAADIQNVLEDGMANISTDSLVAQALAADKACGYPVTDAGEEPGLPHT